MKNTMKNYANHSANLPLHLVKRSNKSSHLVVKKPSRAMIKVGVPINGLNLLYKPNLTAWEIY